jgi:hypothetical protein
MHISCSIEVVRFYSFWDMLWRKEFWKFWRKSIRKILNPRYFIRILRNTLYTTQFTNGGTNETISRERVPQLRWNFVHTYTLVCPTHHKSFVPKFGTVGILWPVQHGDFSNEFSPKIWISLRAGLYQLITSSRGYKSMSRSAWDLYKWLVAKIIFGRSVYGQYVTYTILR